MIDRLKGTFRCTQSCPFFLSENVAIHSHHQILPQLPRIGNNATLIHVLSNTVVVLLYRQCNIHRVGIGGQFTPSPTTLAPILPITYTHHFTIPTPTILSHSPNSTINKIHPFYGLQKEKAGFGLMIVVLNRDEIDTNLLIVSLVEQLYCD